LYSNSDWLLTVGAKTVRTPYLLINGAQAVCEAVRGGLGIAALHQYVVGDDPEIVEVLPNLPKPPISQCIVYPSHLAGLKRVEVFVRFVMDKMKEGF
jgi:Transcriptional regulator